MTRAIVVKRVGAPIVLAPGASMAAQAQAASTTAVAAALTAETARDVALTEGPFYTSVGAGEAATTTGEEFAVVVDGVASWYRRTGGGSDLLYTLPTVATTARITTRAGLETVPIGGTAYATDVNAFYEYDGASSATVDDWGVIDSSGAGRWLLISDGVTVHASGSDDAPTLMAAGNAMGLAGKKLFTPDALYLLDTKWSWGRDPLHLVAHRGVTFECGLTPDGSPATAGFYCSAGGDAIVDTTAIAAANGIGEYTISVDDAPSVGDYVRIRDDVSGLESSVPGFTGATYLVKAVSGSGPYTVTVDRPVLFQVQDGDECVILSDVAKGHFIEGFPTITGTGVRLFEFVGTFHCRVQAIFRPTTITDVAASFDVFGFDNHFLPGCEAYEGGSGATDGMYLESQESSSITAKVRGFTDGVGVSLFHCLDSNDFSDVSECEIGGALRGYGSHGSRGCRLLGIYSGNTLQGAAVSNGSKRSTVDCTARFNPTNLAIGDGSGGNVSETTVRGDYSAATTAGIVIASTALGTSFGIVDTSDCPTGINNQGNVAISLHRHRGAAATQILINAGGDVNIAQIDYNSTTGGINAVKTTGAGRTRIQAGSFNSGAGSNLFRGENSSQTEVGQVVGVTSGGFFASLTSAATMRLASGTDYSGTAGLEGAGTYIIPAKQLYQQVSASNTTAVTTEESLKTYTVPLNTLRIGSRLRVKAFGTVANNANTKTLRLKFGGDTIMEYATPTGVAAGWQIEAEIFVTTLTAESYVANASSDTARKTTSGALTKDVTTNLVVLLTGQNGTASANDIICQGLIVERLAQ